MGRWPALEESALRAFAIAVEEVDLRRARNWAVTTLAIVAAQTEGDARMAATLDEFERSVRAEQPALHVLALEQDAQEKRLVRRVRAEGDGRCAYCRTPCERRYCSSSCRVLDARREKRRADRRAEGESTAVPE